MTEAGKARRPKARKASRAGDEPAQAAASAKSFPSSASSAPDPIDADNLDEAFVKALESDFIANGKSAIIALRREKPVEYMKIVAALRTRDANDAVDPLREWAMPSSIATLRSLRQRPGTRSGPPRYHAVMVRRLRKAIRTDALHLNDALDPASVET